MKTDYKLHTSTCDHFGGDPPIFGFTHSQDAVGARSEPLKPKAVR